MKSVSGVIAPKYALTHTHTNTQTQIEWLVAERSPAVL